MDTFNYILSGFGHATGKYKITNKKLEEATQKDMLEGFNAELIRHSKNYQAYLKDYPQTTPFEYFVGYKMGFHNRYHVTPWPPIKQNQDEAENSLDLLVEAVDKALDNAQLDAEDIDGWIVSTVSQQEQAPGIAATLKCYFTKPENNTPAMTLTSGCAGFNIALRRSLDYFRSRPDIKNILIANTETMSHFLNREKNFVFHATFGDAAAAAIISRTSKLSVHEGVGSIVNYQDLRMIDSVGVDKNWNLYMDGSAVKRRAVPNLINSSKEVLKKEGWTIDDIDLFIPHQTGNAILHTVAHEIGLPPQKMYQGAQHEFGNVSGTTIPIALSVLEKEGILKQGMKLLCPTAGVGGEYGAWTYIVPEKKKTIKKRPHPLIDQKKILVIFADNKLGTTLAEQLKNTNAQAVFHTSNKNQYAVQLLEICEANNNLSVLKQPCSSVIDANKLLQQTDCQWDYVINIGLASETIYTLETVEQAVEQLQKPFDKITREILLRTKHTMLCLSHPLEATHLKMPSPIATIASAWHGLAGSIAGEAMSKGVRTIFYVPAVYNELTHYMAVKDKLLAIKSMKQNAPLKNVDKLANKLIKSLYLLKTAETIDKQQGPMILRKDACAFRKND